MKPIRIFWHKNCGPPSYLCTYLKQRNIPFEIICLDEGLPVPDNLDDVSGLIFMGGSGSVNESKQWIIQELTLIQQAEKKDIPVLGICFGAQLLSKALGGKVSTAESMEIGWHNVKSIATSQKSSVNQEHKYDILCGLPKQFEVFQWHAHTYTLPTGATQLWQNKCCQQQGFIKARMLAMQFHLEVTTDSVRKLSQRYASDLSQSSECTQTLEQIMADLESRVKKLHKIADTIYGGWLFLAGLVDKP